MRNLIFVALLSVTFIAVTSAFTWKQCPVDDKHVDITGINVSPAEVVAPGKVKLLFFTITINDVNFFEGPLKIKVVGNIIKGAENADLSLEIYKKVLVWIKLPCLNLKDFALPIGSW